MDEEIKKSLFDIKTSIESIHDYLGETRGLPTLEEEIKFLLADEDKKR